MLPCHGHVRGIHTENGRRCCCSQPLISWGMRHISLIPASAAGSQSWGRWMLGMGSRSEWQESHLVSLTWFILLQHHTHHWDIWGHMSHKQFLYILMTYSHSSCTNISPSFSPWFPPSKLVLKLKLRLRPKVVAAPRWLLPSQGSSGGGRSLPRRWRWLLGGVAIKSHIVTI